MNWLLKTLAKWRGLDICLGCNHIIDWSCCHCGDPISSHSMWSGHSPIPMGCVCGYDKAEEMQQTKFQLLKDILTN